jgi:UDP-N-acetylglucosamine acyltransferase
LETRRELSKAFRLVYRSKLRFDEALDRVENELPKLPEVVHWIEFCRSSRRGLIGLQGVIHLSEEDFMEFDSDSNELYEVSTPGAL